VGGLAALVDRSIWAANAIGKTADTIGVGVEALQELRFAAKASGVEQQTLDMARHPAWRSTRPGGAPIRSACSNRRRMWLSSRGAAETGLPDRGTTAGGYRRRKLDWCGRRVPLVQKDPRV
jgi:hypothetical protein